MSTDASKFNPYPSDGGTPNPFTPSGSSAPSSGASTPVASYAGLPFPVLVLAALIVAAGIWAADQWDSRAAWALAFLVLLIVAFGYRSFGNELLSILQSNLKGQTSSTSSPNTTSSSSPNGVVVGPTGPIGSGG